MAQEDKRETVNMMVVGSIPLGGKKYLIFSFRRSSNKAKRATQHAVPQNSAESGERYCSNDVWMF